MKTKDDYFKELRFSLKGLFRFNYNFLTGSISADEFNLSFSAYVDTIVSKEYFMPCNRGLNNEFHLKRALGVGCVLNHGDNTDKSLYQGGTCLCPVPDKRFLYLRSHAREEVDRFHLLPNRDLLISSYKWSSCFPLAPLMDSSVSDHSLLKFLSFLYSCDLGIVEKQKSDLLFDVAFWGFSESNHGQIMRQSVPFDSLSSLFTTPHSSSLSLRRRYDFIAIKLSDESVLSSTISPARMDVNNLSSHQPASNTFCIFVDSLDLSCVDDPLVSPYLRAIPRLMSRSKHYTNFTSSGDWTFPCLDSLHSGYPPHRTFSAYRSDPFMDSIGPNMLTKMLLRSDNYTPRDLFDIFNYSRGGVEFAALAKITSSDSRDPINLLSNKLRDFGINVGAVKAAQNHSWRFGWIGATSFSIENCSFLDTSRNLQTLFSLLNPSFGTNCFLIDMDLMHGGLFFTDSDFKCPEHLSLDHFDWIDGYESSEDNFLATGIDDFRLKKNYLSKLLLFDSHLDKLLDILPEDSNIVLWSDHGSNFYPYSGSSVLNGHIPLDSGAKLEKIWKPSLLVSSPVGFSIDSYSVSDELVSTCDLYSILLALCGLSVDPSVSTSILPKSLGGDYSRQVALTFGVAYERLGKKKPLDAYRWDLIARYGDSGGELFSTSDFPRFISVPNSEYIKGVFPELCARFPREMV